MRNNLVCLIFLTMMISSQIFAGTVYYVDATNGNDQNDGFSPDTAWQTITRVNNSSFSAGDSILFKRNNTWIDGNAWSGRLAPSSSGSSGNPITFGAYGSGANPIIDARDLLNDPFMWMNEGGNIWSQGSINRCSACWINDVMQAEATDAESVNSTNKYFYDSDNSTIYVYATENPAIAYTNPGVHVDESRTAIWLFQVHHIKIDGLELKGGNEIYGCIGFRDDVHDVAIINCTIKKTTRGINLYNDWPSGQGKFYDITISNNIIEFDQFNSRTGDGLRAEELQDSIISGNTFKDAYHSALLILSTTVNHDACQNNIIEYNTFEWSENSYYGRALNFDGAEGKCTNNHIRYNYIKNQPTKSQINGNGNYTYYNIWDEGQEAAFQKHPGEDCAALNLCAYSGWVCHDNYIFNNVIYKAYHEGISIWGWEGQADLENNTIKNNIIIGCDAAGDNIQISYRNASQTKDQIIQYNCLYSSATNGVVDFKGTVYTVEQAEQNVTGWINNMQQNPLFVNAANGDISLQETSPCIDTGIDVGLTEDFAGNTVPYGYGIDIGAYEYTGENPPLNANVDASPASGETPLTVNFTSNATGGTSPYSYSWDFGDGGYSTEQNPSHTYYADGNYTAILTVTDNESSQNSDSVTITVTAPLTPVVASGSASPNSGDSPLTVDFTGNATGGAPPYTYYWNFGDGQSSTQQNPSHTYNNDGNYTATLTVTDNNSNQDSDSLIISVTAPAPPPLVASCIASPTSGDVPFTVYFTGIANGGTPPHSFSWNFGDGGNSTLQNPSHIYNAEGNYTATLTVTDSQSIQDNVSLTITATLSPTPAYLSCSPTDFYFKTSVSVSQTEVQKMRIINAGDGTMTWNVEENTPWLSCFPSSGTNRGQVAISVNASGLSPGTYDAIITASSPQAYNSPQFIAVNLKVYELGVEIPDGNPLSGRDSVAGLTLNDIKARRAGIKKNSDPNNPTEATESGGLVAMGNILIADNSTEKGNLKRPELNTPNQENKTGILTIGLKEIRVGLKPRSSIETDTEENRITIDQAKRIAPIKQKSQLENERESINIKRVQIEEMEPLRIVFTSSLRENISFIGWGEDEQTTLPSGSTLDMVKDEFSWVPPYGSIGKYVFHFAVTDGSDRSQPLRIIVDVIPRIRD